MLVLLLLQCLFVAVLVLYPGDVAGQFTAAPPTCPGDTFTFRCSVSGNMNGVTIWRVAGSIECILVHRATSIAVCGNAFTARPEAGFGTNGPFFSSTLSGTAEPTMNGTLVECFGPANNVDPANSISGSALQIIGPTTISTLSCVNLSGDVSGSLNVTVNWSLSGGDSADFYLITITTNAPQTPYGGILNITTGSVTQHELTGFKANYEYNITISGVNCASQERSESEPLMIRPQVPATPRYHVCALYDMVDGTLQIIESTWNEVDGVTVSEDCVSVRGITASYELSYATDSGVLNTICVIEGTECSNGVCHHELQNNTADSRCQPPVSQFSEDLTVSVTARNIVGRNNHAVSKRINGRNIDLVVHIDITNLSSAFLECTFFQPGYTCTIDYGTDPSYTNLVFRDTSSTQGRSTTITLAQKLRANTIYYYIVSAKSSSQCVKVQGRFRAECNVTDLGVTTGSGTVDPKCTNRGFSDGLSFPEGVICYNGVTAGSTAIYICDDGFALVGNEARVCQSNGSWNDRTPQCISQESDQIGLVVGLMLANISIIIITIVIVVVIIVRRKSSSKGDDSTNALIQKHERTPSIQEDLSALHMAAGEGDLHEVKDLVGRKANINIKSNNGVTPLHMAAREGHTDIVTYLVDKRAHINSGDNDRRTPLHVAAECGHMDIVKYLVGKGAELKKNKDGRTPLFMAAGGGHIDMVKYFVDVKRDEIDTKDVFERTPLHMAVEGNHKETVEYLVEEGAAINIQDKWGETPLHIAAKQGNLNIVTYLVDKEANFAIRNHDERTPLHKAARRAHVGIVKYLVYKAADIGVKDINGNFRSFLVKLARIGEPQWTPLYMAAEGGHEKMVRCLVDEGADINIKDENGETPLHVACRQGYVDTVKYLVDKGARTDIQDNDGRTPLDASVESGYNEITNYLKLVFGSHHNRSYTTTI